MANIKPEKERIALRAKVMLAAAKLFLHQGYTQTSLREISDTAGVQISAMNRAFGSKEHILLDLVEYVLEGQFAAAKQFLKGKTEDPILFYAAETTLQLHMAESAEHIRELYAVAYSLPETSQLIMKAITDKLEDIFRAHLPELETKDFYELEIASGGIMRSFMTVPCDMYFTMERKIRRFLETTFKIYDVPKEKIEEAIAFVAQFDYPALAQNTINELLSRLDETWSG